MTDLTIVAYLVSGIIIFLTLFCILIAPAYIKMAKLEVELTRMGGEENQSAPEGLARLKIPSECPKTDHDFIVDLECPDGTIVRVSIPLDADSYEGRCSRVSSKHDSPVGLNLVCPGHYT